MKEPEAVSPFKEAEDQPNRILGQKRAREEDMPIQISFDTVNTTMHTTDANITVMNTNS